MTSSHWTAKETRYDTLPYRRVGKSGLKLPALSLGQGNQIVGQEADEQ